MARRFPLSSAVSRRLAQLACLLPLAALGSSGALPACAASAGADAATESPGAAAEPIVKGTASDASQDAVVLLINQIDSGGYECTATLVAPNLVVTARHCVSALSNPEEGFACDEQGNVIGSGGGVGADFTASHLYVQVGAARADLNKADAHGAKIFHDDGTVLCNHDLALVLLDAAVPGARIAPIRLNDIAVPGESFTAVGWGVVTNTETSPRTRQQRAGITVVDVGPAADANLQVYVAPSEFVVGESTCSGDSGGPALDTKTGAVIGVVSRGGNGVSPNADGSNIGDTCTGTEAVNFYTQISPFKAVVDQAFAAAGQAPWIEGQPNPLLGGPGTACASDGDCQSAVCAASVCTTTCTSDSSCPAASSCATQGDRKVCAANMVTSTKPGGCAASSVAVGVGASAPGGGVVALGLLGVIGVIARGARRRLRI